MSDGKFLVLVLCLVTVASRCSCKDYHIYMSPHGDDQSNGTSRGKPIRTLDRALSQANSVTQNASDTVYVEMQTGYYDLDKILYIKPTVPKLVVRAYHHQDVHITGGKRINSTAFHRVSNRTVLAMLPLSARQHVRVVHLPDVNITDYGVMKHYGLTHSRVAPLEIFYNGQPLHMARWPDTGYINIVNVPDGQHGRRFQYNATEHIQWKNEPDPWAYGFWHESWADLGLKIDHVDTTTHIVTLAEKTQYGLRNGYYNQPDARGTKQGGYFRFENILSALDSPGEYYLDRTTGNLYAWMPSSDGNVNETDVIYVSLINECIKFNAGVSNVVLSDFTLEACRYNGIRGNTNTNIQITNVQVRNMGNVAIGFYGDCRDIHIANCLVHDVAGGIYIEGGNRTTLESSGQIIENNEIYNYGRVTKSGRHGISVKGVGQIVRHNTIYNGPYDAFVYYYSNDVIFEWNHVHHVCMDTSTCYAVRTSGDWSNRGCAIRYNIFHDIRRRVPGNDNRVVSLDDHHSSTAVTNNVFFNNDIHVSIGGGRDNVLANNILYNASIYSIRIEDGRTSDQHLTVLMDRLHAVPYNSGLWTTRYSDLVKFDAKNKTLPEGNQINKNIIYNPKEVKYLYKSGRYELLDLYNITQTGASMGSVDHVDVTTGDFRLVCHAFTWANQVNFVQVATPDRYGPAVRVGPRSVHRTAYNPLKRGHSHHCTTQAPAKITPVGAYLPDGSGHSDWYDIPRQGCWLDVEKCTDNEFAVGLDRDTWGEANFNTSINKTACLAQAVAQWEECGSHTKEQVTAIYAPTGAMTLGGDGCFIARYGCPKHGGPTDGHAQLNGARRTAGAGCWIYVDKCPARISTKTVFYDAWGATNLMTDDHEEACLGQAWRYWKQCGSDPEYPATAVFRPTTASMTVP